MKHGTFFLFTLIGTSIASAQEFRLRSPEDGAGAGAKPSGFNFEVRPERGSRPQIQAPSTGASPVVVSPAARGVKAPVSVDESALRYYASQNDSARVASEIRRIRALNPEWSPPEDLFEDAPDSTEEQHLWGLYGEGKLDEIRTAMEELKERIPNWRPSAELAAKMDHAQARLDLIEASSSGDHAQVIALAEARASLLVCPEMDVLWRVGEALVKTGTPEKGFELYRFILTRCPDPQERLATIHKASILLAPTMTEKLLALGPRGAERSQFENARADLLRRRIGEAITSGAEVNAADLKPFEASVEQRRLADDAMLLGWLRYSRKDWVGAGQWFKLASSWGTHPKAVEGSVLALREQGKLAEAEKLAFESRKIDPLLSKLYVEIVAVALTEEPARPIEPTRLAQVEEAVRDVKSVMGSQALGWHHYKLGSMQNAHKWFQASVTWEPIEANVLGLALTSYKMKNLAAFRAIVAEYGGRYPAVRALNRIEVATRVRRLVNGKPAAQAGSKLAQEAVGLFKSGQYRATLDTLNRRAATAKEDDGLSLLRGWSLYHTGEYTQARAHFEAMDAKQSTKDTQYGKFYSNERLVPPQFRAD